MTRKIICLRKSEDSVEKIQFVNSLKVSSRAWHTLSAIPMMA